MGEVESKCRRNSGIKRKRGVSAKIYTVVGLGFDIFINGSAATPPAAGASPDVNRVDARSSFAFAQHGT